jgi:dolichyl-phosphate-mannose-protein mannosyltransferase
MSGLGLEWSPVRAADVTRAALASAARRLQASIDRSPVPALAVLTTFYLCVVAVLSSLKLLWLDELITVHIAQLGSVGAIWNALAQGADPNPPISHLLVHASRMIFGDHEWAYRLPSFLGYGCGLVSLFAFLARRIPATWALAGTVLSMAMAAFDYSFESRSYAIVDGLVMLAVLCWSVAVDPASRRSLRNLALAAMVLALAAGISTNYFAVLAILPIAAGEVVRTLRALRESRHMQSGLARPRRFAAIDFPIWIGLFAAGSTLLAYRKMIAHAIAQFAPYAWNKVSIDQVFDSYTEMVEVVLYPILALFAFALVLFFVSRQLAPACRDCRTSLARRWIGSVMFPASRDLPVPAHEAAAIFALMTYPILGYVVASLRGGMLSPRFVIPVCFGFAIAATLVAYRLFRSLPRAGVAMLCFCLAWFIARESVVAAMYAQQKQAFYNLVDALPEAEAAVPSGTPIVIPDPLLALTFRHYAPASLAARVVFPLDFPAIRTFRHDDSPEENLWAGRNILYPMPIVPLAMFQHAAGNYLIIAKDENWLIEDLRAHLYPVRRLPIETHAKDIGGFTPLAHGTPAFYVGVGDAVLSGRSLPGLVPEPFRAADNLPGSRSMVPGETTQNPSK